MKYLGVKGETLEKHGAVSYETAFEMAEGLRKNTGADVTVGITGIAGPTGGTKEKPDLYMSAYALWVKRK